MRTFAITVAVIGLAVADVSHLKSGYHYNVPHTSYGVPSQAVADSTHHTTDYTSSSHNTNYQQAQPVHNYVTSLSGQQSDTTYDSGYNTGNNYQQTTGGNYQQNTGSNYHQNSGVYQQSSGVSGVQGLSQPSYQSVSSGNYQTVSQPSSGQHSYNNYQSSSQYNYQEQYQQQPAQVFKHFYVHTAPEEPEQPKFRQPVVLPPPQKHYKIIFIKTPSPPPSPPQVIPVQPQTEEKTIVYVLVKKPEETPEPVLPKIEQKAPTKPEVFFIKYNEKQDSQAVINNIVSNINGQSSGSSVTVSGLENNNANLHSGQVLEDHSHTVGLSSSDVSSSSQGFGVSGVTSEVQSSSSGVSGGYTGLSANDVNQGSYTSGGSSVSGGYTGLSANNVAQGSYTTGDVSSQTSADYITSQGTPHQTYGVPHFRSH